MADEVHPKLLGSKGIVCRQQSQYAEDIAQFVGLPFEMRNRYRISLMPSDKRVGTAPDDPERWQPSGKELEQLDNFLFVTEESSCWERVWTSFCGVANLRRLSMHFSLDASTGDVYLIRREFQCGGWIGCPLEMNLFQVNGAEENHIGRVKEKFKFFDCCFRCTLYHQVETSDDDQGPKYTLRASLCCCGRVNNCCGATCWKNDTVMDILDANGQVVAHLQKTYAPAPNCSALCRCCHQYNNYILEFPPNSNVQERMLLITALFQLEYHVFEKSGNE